MPVACRAASQCRSRGRRSVSLAWHGAQIVQAPGPSISGAWGPGRSEVAEDKASPAWGLTETSAGESPEATEQGVLCVR